jgi:hypothetical protein
MWACVSQIQFHIDQGKNAAFLCPRAHQEWDKALTVVVVNKNVLTKRIPPPAIFRRECISMTIMCMKENGCLSYCLNTPNPTKAPVPVPLVIDGNPAAACDDEISATSARFVSCHSGNANLDETPTNDSTDSTIGGNLNGDEDDDEVEEIDNGGDAKPDEWYFPGHIAFALFGPIVPPAMVP